MFCCLFSLIKLVPRHPNFDSGCSDFLVTFCNKPSAENVQQSQTRVSLHSRCARWRCWKRPCNRSPNRGSGCCVDCRLTEKWLLPKRERHGSGSCRFGRLNLLRLTWIHPVSGIKRDAVLSDLPTMQMGSIAFSEGSRKTPRWCVYGSRKTPYSHLGPPSCLGFRPARFIWRTRIHRL